MIFDIGEKVHIIERRYFQTDLRRHFVGEIVRCTNNAIRVVGYSWIYDQTKGEYIRKDEKREKVYGISGDGRLVINVIPINVDLEAISYQVLPEEGLVVTDGNEFVLNIREFMAS